MGELQGRIGYREKTGYKGKNWVSRKLNKFINFQNGFLIKIF
jgi:hypothetical protein